MIMTYLSAKEKNVLQLTSRHFREIFLGYRFKKSCTLIVPSYRYGIYAIEMCYRTGTALPLGLMKDRRYATMGISGNKSKLVVVGGREYLNCLSSAECYDFGTKQWEALPNMRTKRGTTSGVFLADGLTFLVTGGDNGKILSSCEQLSLTTRTWSPAAVLSGPRGGHCTVLYNSKPVVLGGCNGSGWLNMCEQYSPTNNTWSIFPAFKSGRAYFAAAVVLDKLYIAGGMGAADSVEVYDGSAWADLPFSLPQNTRYNCTMICMQGKLVVIGKNRNGIHIYTLPNDEEKTGEWKDNGTLYYRGSQYFGFIEKIVFY